MCLLIRPQPHKLDADDPEAREKESKPGAAVRRPIAVGAESGLTVGRDDMNEPQGYRILARRLARDLRVFVEEVAQIPDIHPDDYTRIWRRAARTLHRFDAYEQTHKGKRGSG